MGLPWVGETLAITRNIFGFLEQRHRRHGPVFKSGVFGRKVVFLAGTAGAEAFYDADNITRADAFPFPLVDLFGGINMAMYDGPRHFALKSMALTAFDRAALAGYLPDLERQIEETLARLARGGAFSAVAELRRLAIEAICRNVMGLEPGPDTAAITRDYGLVLTGVLSLPLPFPGTPYARARAARDRLLARIHRVIRERRAVPGTDGLSRILAARADDGRAYTDEEATLEVHHMMIAGYIVYALMAEAMRHLALQPELGERCLAEVRAHAASGPLTRQSLSRLALVTNVVLEAKRWTPIVPLAFGRALRSFRCGGFEIPAGWTVYLSLSINNRDGAIYSEPDRFDPDRFGAGRAEHRRHPMAFIPQGAEPPTGHRCLGLDYSTLLSATFLTLLLRGYEWELPPQDLSYDWRPIPPVPRGGLRMRLTGRVAGESGVAG
jgi:cytochrome P450